MRPPFTALLRLGFAPGMLLLFNAAAWVCVQANTPWALPLLLALAATLSWAAERCIPYQADWNRPQGDTARDLSHALVNEGLCALGIWALPQVQAWLPHARLWPAQWAPGWQWLLAVIAADLGITLMHRASHHVPVLWRFHAVHHSVTRMHGLNGLLKHPVHLMLEMAAGVLPLVLLGLPQAVATLLAFSIALQLLLQHSNADMRTGPLLKLLALAPYHRFHHLRSAREGNVNFGLFLTLWDRLLGEAVEDPGRRFQSADLGIEDRPDYPVAYLQQLLEPLRAQERPERLSETAGGH